MKPLVTLSEVQQFKQVSDSINKAKFNELVLQVQQMEIYPLLGEDLYWAVINDSTNYLGLLDGGTYEYQGKTYQNVGLKAVISHYLYAYKAFYGDVNDTAFGLREKLNNDVSKQVDTSMKKTLFEHNCKYAFNLWLNVERFLERTNEPLYKCGQKIKNTNFIISKVGR